MTLNGQETEDRVVTWVTIGDTVGGFDVTEFSPDGEPLLQTVLSLAFDDGEPCGMVQGELYPDSAAGTYDVGWFWTDPEVDEGGTGRDHFIGCFFGG